MHFVVVVVVHAIYYVQCNLVINNLPCTCKDIARFPIPGVVYLREMK